MKTLFVALGIVAATSFGVSAQTVEETVTAQSVNSNKVPVEVLNAYKKDFPGGKTISDWKLLPKGVFKDHYAISKSGDDSMKDADNVYYTIYFSGKGTSARAIYTQEGKLAQYSEKAKNIALPVEIVNAIQAKYPGAKITGDTETIKLNPKSQTFHYRVSFTQNKKRGYAIVDQSGNITKSHLK